jgi:hypothetical protein
MRRISRRHALRMIGSAAGAAACGAVAARRAVAAPTIAARVIARGIPGASAIAEIGRFLNDPNACARPIRMTGLPTDRLTHSPQLTETHLSSPYFTRPCAHRKITSSCPQHPELYPSPRARPAL